MDFIPVSSSNLKSVAYDAARQVLEIKFHTGGHYRYFNVPAHIHAGLMSAPSKGQYFDAYIKKGGYRFEKA